ncbi:MAG: DNA methylase [Dehalococcoidia bacterium]|nr:DNA methylase [Dehalococcoidia bacterium]
MGERGVYDIRNPLNELTGREWIYFLNSVWITAYPPVADTFGFDVRKIHPSPKPPPLMRDIIQFFTKPGEWVLDPFAGVGGTLLGASLCEPQRHAVGIDIVRQYVDAYYEASRRLGLVSQDMMCGDSRDLEALTKKYERQFDLIATDPPYCDMMNRRKVGQKKKLYGIDHSSPFSSLKEDISNLPYDAFLDTLRDILASAVILLREKRYLVVFCRDLQPTKDNPNLVHADVINRLTQIPGLAYRGMRIWHDQATDLYPFGYPYAFVMNQMHQYILIFRKERGS